MAASNLTIRLATAGVMVPLIIALLFWGPAWGWLLFLLVASVTAALEVFSMAYPGDTRAKLVGIAMTWALVLAIWFAATRPWLLLAVVLLVPVCSVLLALWRFSGVEGAALQMATGSFGTLWVGVGFGSVAAIRVVGGHDGPAYVVLALGLAWLTDTGGYFTGRAWGKHKLWPAVSPNKTVEGAIGGVVIAVGSVLVARLVLIDSLSLRDAVMLGVIGSVAGILGDLGESLLKRSVGIKDSGGIVPGHGGMLDRVDAVMVTAPITLSYLWWLH